MKQNPAEIIKLKVQTSFKENLVLSQYLNFVNGVTEGLPPLPPPDPPPELPVAVARGVGAADQRAGPARGPRLRGEADRLRPRLLLLQRLHQGALQARPPTGTIAHGELHHIIMEPLCSIGLLLASNIINTETKYSVPDINGPAESTAMLNLSSFLAV